MIENVSNISAANERVLDGRPMARADQGVTGPQDHHVPVPASTNRVEMTGGLLASMGTTDASSQSVVAARSARLEAATGDAAIHKSMSEIYREDAARLTRATASGTMTGEVRIFPEHGIKPERDTLA